MKQNSNHRTEEEYYIESKRLRAEVMQIADTLKNCPMRFTVTNGIKMDVEVTKSDLKTIASKNTQDNRKISNTGLFKPYAIIDQKTFDAEIQNLRK